MSDSADLLPTYLDTEGRVTCWPSRQRRAAQRAVLDYLAARFEPGREYTEREVNDLLRSRHTFDDWALLRRELFEQGYLNRARDGSVYWRTPQTKLY
mgnify:CR=1 FL=1